jgi:hypothetical protein
VAIKIESSKAMHSQLKYESVIYQLLQGGSMFCSFVFTGCLLVVCYFIFFWRRR